MATGVVGVRGWITFIPCEKKMNHIFSKARATLEILIVAMFTSNRILGDENLASV